MSLHVALGSAPSDPRQHLIRLHVFTSDELLADLHDALVGLCTLLGHLLDIFAVRYAHAKLANLFSELVSSLQLPFEVVFLIYRLGLVAEVIDRAQLNRA